MIPFHCPHGRRSLSSTEQDAGKLFKQFKIRTKGGHNYESRKYQEAIKGNEIQLQGCKKCHSVLLVARYDDFYEGHLRGHCQWEFLLKCG